MFIKLRKRNTNKDGNAWTQKQIEQVWGKGILIPHFSPESWRLDKCGVIIKFDEFGNENSEYGWEIDHIISVSNEGNDNIENLQPLNWINNVVKDHKLKSFFQQNKTSIVTNYPLSMAI